MPATNPSRRRILIWLIKLVVSVAVVWFVWDTLRQGINDLDRGDWQVDYGWLTAVAVLYLLGLFPAALFWHRVLVAFHQRPPLAATLRAYYIGHLGKYVPGKALVVVIRANLLAKHGVRIVTGMVTVVVESLTMLGVGQALAAIVGVVLFHDQFELWAGGLLMMLIVGVPTLPPIANAILFARFGRLLLLEPKSAEGGSPDPEDLAAAQLVSDDERLDVLSAESSGSSLDVPRISWQLTFWGWSLNIIGWCVLGLSLWAALRSLVPNDLAPLSALPIYTAAVALAMVAGFASGLPGGIGVRDGVLVAVLAQTVPNETALVAAVLVRIVWLVSEVVISAILYLGGRATPIRHSNSVTKPASK